MPMILIESLPSVFPSPTSRADLVVLTWEQRGKTRQAVVTQGALELAIKLPTGTRLPPGCIVYVGEGFHVEVVAAPEDVWVVTAADRSLLLRTAHEIGNRHFPIDCGNDEIAVLYDHTLDELWGRLGVQAKRSRRPFLSEQRPHHHHA
jgi:urease accessory protein